METKLRGLKTSDIYKMSRILKKMNMDILVDDGTSQVQAGVQFLQKAAENLHLAEEEVNDFMGGIAGVTGEEFAEMPIEQSMKIIEHFKNQKGLTSFFELANKSTK